MAISGKASIAGVIGYPVKHSLSPRLHNFWLDQYGIDGVYIPMEVAPHDIERVVRTFPLMGFKGCNVTVPHKESVYDVVDVLTDTARKIGAVNTVTVQPDGSLTGTNTDAYGFIENIRSCMPHFAFDRGNGVVLGAGGAARAVCAGLLEAGMHKIYLLNRTREKAEAIRNHIHKTAIEVIDWEEKEEVLTEASLLVNTTTLGMVGFKELELNLHYLRKNALVTDIVYKPLETTLLKHARERGNPVVDGIGMLLYQAVPGFEAWFGKKPTVTNELREYVLSAIG